ncbi:alpha/beta hydrolase family protein [Corynebacterium freneyi]|uniref:alpha/beta hydrolase family protein n=1 Tax=Corynebacterium freneyi TaxID=134034 RepID=UPI00396CECAA
MRQKRTMWGRRSMLKLLGLAAVGATAGVVTGRFIDVADSGASSDGSASRAVGGSPSAAAPAPAPPGPRVRPTIVDSGSPKTMRMTYGADPRQFGDLHLPPAMVEGVPAPTTPAARAQTPAPNAARAVPLVVMIHGGGWMDSSTVAGTAHQAEDLADAGVAVWNIEYRGTGGAGGWPRTYEDVAAAIDVIPFLADASPVPLDLGRVVVTGVSAGGSLAAWAANREALPDGVPGARPKFPIRNCVAMCGVYDLARAIRWGDPYIRPLLGGTPEEYPDRYRNTSPIAYMGRNVRMVILHGRNDSVVDVQQAISYEAASRRARRPVVMRLFDDAAHSSWNDLAGPQWRAAKEAILHLVA